MGPVLIYLWIGLIITPIMLLFAIYWIPFYSREPLVLICGSIFTLFGLLSLLYCLKELGMLRRIDYYNSPVLEIQKQLLAFKTFYQKVKKFEFYTLPIPFVSGSVFILKVLYKFGYPKLDMIEIIIILLITMPLSYLLGIWIYRNLYDKKVKAAQRHLAELREFEKEEE
jgi:hypothetical protein